MAGLGERFAVKKLSSKISPKKPLRVRRPPPFSVGGRRPHSGRTASLSQGEEKLGVDRRTAG